MRRCLRYALLAACVAVLAFFGYGLATGTHGLPSFGKAAAGEATTPDRIFTGPSDEVITVPGQVYTPSVVTETVTTTVTTTAPPPAELPYLFNGFEGSIQSAVTQAPQYLSWFPSTGVSSSTFDSNHWVVASGGGGARGVGPSGQGLGLWVRTSDGTPGTSNPLGQTFVGVHPSDSHTLKGETTWYRVAFRLPPGGAYAPAGSPNGPDTSYGSTGFGDFGIFEQWHEQIPSAQHGSADSMTMNMANWHYAPGQDWTTDWSLGGTPTNVPALQLKFYCEGGDAGAPTRERWYTAYNDPLLIGVWYDLLVKFVWDTKASNAGGVGAVSIWLNKGNGWQVFPAARQITNANGIPDANNPAWANPHPFPTLYTGTAGAIDRPSYGLYNYRGRYRDTRMDFDNWQFGPTAASVGAPSLP